MKKNLILTAMMLTLFSSNQAMADKLVNFSFGPIQTPEEENFSFGPIQTPEEENKKLKESLHNREEILNNILSVMQKKNTSYDTVPSLIRDAVVKYDNLEKKLNGTIEMLGFAKTIIHDEGALLDRIYPLVQHSSPSAKAAFERDLVKASRWITERKTALEQAEREMQFHNRS